MKTNFTHTRLAMATLSVAALFGVLGPAAAQADGELPKGYIMNVFGDTAMGTAVEGGAYETVIEKLTEKDARGARRIADQVNLCVAYAKTKQIDKATESCDRALEMAGTTVRRASFETLRAAQARANDQRAIALINRGVLHAVVGEDDKAQDLFEAAANLGTDNTSAALNLLVLQRELAEKDT